MELRDYQVEIAERASAILRDHGMVYLAMEVRTGKTLTSLEIARRMGARRLLFLTKKKAISSIENDAEAMGLDIDITVINYEQIDKVTGEWDMIIVDEAHGLGAFPKPSQRAENLRRIVRDAWVVYLSGTPTPESYSQLYHQFWICANRSPWAAYVNFYKWAAEYVDVKDRKFGHAMVKDYSHAKKDKVMADVAHLFISYSQADAGFEAMVEEEILLVDMKPSTMKVIEALRRDKLFQGKMGDVVADTEVKLMSKMHQICSGSVIVDAPKREAIGFDYTKAEYIRDKFAGQKIAIFYKFIAEGMMLRFIFGSRVKDTPEDFNAGDVNAVYISQIVSGREGINLSTADALIMYNIDFAAVSYFQARARIQTKDRQRPARLYWIFANGGIEEKIYKAVSNKKDYTLRYFKKDYL